MVAELGARLRRTVKGPPQLITQVSGEAFTDFLQRFVLAVNIAISDLDAAQLLTSPVHLDTEYKRY